MDHVRAFYRNPNQIASWLAAPRIDQTDYLIVYAPTGQSVEVTFTFLSPPSADLTNAPEVSLTQGSDSLTFNTIIEGTASIPVKVNNRVSTVLIITDKATAGTWHAPVIAGSGTFGNYFSVGTNQTYGLSVI